MKKRNTILLVLLATAAALALTPVAGADTVTFYASGSLAGEITLTLDPIAPGYWGITNVAADLTSPGTVDFNVPTFGYDPSTKTYLPGEFITSG
jgi:hypothetical protein